MQLAPTTSDAAALGAGLLVVRLVLGLVMAGHGAQKLFGWFGGHGIRGTAGFFESIGFRPGVLFATAAAVGEFGSGVLLALGLLGPVGPAVMLSVMIVAAVTMHWHGLFAPKGVELTLLYAAGAVAIGLTGPGAWSLDALLGLDAEWTPTLRVAVLAAGAVGGVANLMVRRPVAPAAA